MSPLEKILNKIIKWAKLEDSVRGLIVEGSIAQDQGDNLSDIDISIFAKDIGPFVKDDSWLSKIANVWVYSADKYYFGDVLIPTRLVVYEDGIKVDYSLWNIDIVDDLSKAEYFDTGYKILLDKDNLLENFEKPSLKPKLSKKPTEEEFIHTVNEFWFEAYHVAKYLKREDLWLAKSRDWSIKEMLLKMMEWHTLAKNNWKTDVKWLGKHIKNWLEPEIYNRLNNIFGHFDSEDSWKSLITTIDLFRYLSKETSKLLSFTYPDDVDKNLTGFIDKLYKN